MCHLARVREEAVVERCCDDNPGANAVDRAARALTDANLRTLQPR
jgi:hypothetical protein